MQILARNWTNNIACFCNCCFVTSSWIASNEALCGVMVSETAADFGWKESDGSINRCEFNCVTDVVPASLISGSSVIELATGTDDSATCNAHHVNTSTKLIVNTNRLTYHIDRNHRNYVSISSRSWDISISGFGGCHIGFSTSGLVGQYLNLSHSNAGPQKCRSRSWDISISGLEAVILDFPLPVWSDSI